MVCDQAGQRCRVKRKITSTRSESGDSHVTSHRATITFKAGEPPKAFTLHHTGEGKPWTWPNRHSPIFMGQTWRFLSDDCALELVPLCDAGARPVSTPPLCDRLEVWPVCWDLPDSLIADHPAEVEAMRRDHLAGKHEYLDRNDTWMHWLETKGKLELWFKLRSPEMERHWLSSYTPPGSTLFLWAGTAGCVSHEVRERIQFRADFHRGAQVETIWLADCAPDSLTVEEKQLSPAFFSRQEELLRKRDAVNARERKLVADKTSLETLKARSRKEAARQARQRAQQNVPREVVRAELKVGDRGVLKICSRYKVKWPKTRGELDRLVIKNTRHKRAVEEAAGKRIKKYAQERRGSPKATSGSF